MCMRMQAMRTNPMNEHAADTTPCGRATCTTCTVAELVNDPNRPNTNPAIATAAMSVIAIGMTMAMTGDVLVTTL
jgi:hypothetical protein